MMYYSLTSTQAEAKSMAGRRQQSAVPAAWAAAGRVTGIGARGGFRVDLTWRDGKVSSATVHSVGGTKTTLKHGGWSKTIALRAGESITVAPES